MYKSGDLDKEPGKKMITERLDDGGAMLAAMYASAWKLSEVTDKEAQEFVKYDRWEGIKDMKPHPEAKPKQGTSGKGNGGGQSGGSDSGSP
jgi:hypothetical protein